MRIVPKPARGPSGLWRATVARVAGTEVFVVVPRLSPQREYGPVDVARGTWATSTGTGGTDGHTHPSGDPLAAGDRVLVGFVEDNPDDLVLICRLA